ncbi:MAG TPA: NUDIX hydrolase [Candidatus Gallacutalibacter pullicola]|uniref:NUDIX hydrolase n=1 Tax=Candidatus Gallacutalibacter pullicola TaxID=2840830 RepID=A0A9D1DPW8_9FIRM|nr:NUDIX hydrolase [Candidatus Gallacutalibacter pullicola]
MKLTEKTLSQEYKYRGKIVNLRVDDAELENGHVTKREVVEHPGGVTIGALTDKNELLFVRQFRYPYQQVILETPAGKLEPGEDAFEAGKRELKEETGATGRDFQFLGNMYPTPGYCGEIIRLYACRVDGYGEMDPDDDEFLEVERIPLDKAVQMVMDNEIPDGKTQILILKIAALVRENKI